jgi:hypothetical protein
MLNIMNLHKSKNEFSRMSSNLQNFVIQRVALLLRPQVSGSDILSPTTLTKFRCGFPRPHQAISGIYSALK